MGHLDLGARRGAVGGHRPHVEIGREVRSGDRRDDLGGARGIVGAAVPGRNPQLRVLGHAESPEVELDDALVAIRVLRVTRTSKLDANPVGVVVMNLQVDSTLRVNRHADDLDRRVDIAKAIRRGTGRECHDQQKRESSLEQDPPEPVDYGCTIQISMSHEILSLPRRRLTRVLGASLYVPSRAGGLWLVVCCLRQPSYWSSMSPRDKTDAVP